MDIFQLKSNWVLKQNAYQNIRLLQRKIKQIEPIQKGQIFSGHRAHRLPKRRTNMLHSRILQPIHPNMAEIFHKGYIV